MGLQLRSPAASCPRTACRADECMSKCCERLRKVTSRYLMQHQPCAVLEMWSAGSNREQPGSSPGIEFVTLVDEERA